MGNRRKPHNPTYGPAMWTYSASDWPNYEAKADELMATFNPRELRHMIATLLCMQAAFAARWTDTEREALTKDIQTGAMARVAIAKGGDTPAWTSER